MLIDFERIVNNNPHTHSTNYPPSYYAATVNNSFKAPELDEIIRTEVCVIGGGFSGVNTALELAEKGLSVVLLEARDIGWGASGRNGGQLLHGIGQDIEKFRRQLGEQQMNLLYDMGFEAIEIVLNRIKKYDIQCDLKMGATMVALRQRHMQEIQQTISSLENRNYPYSIKLHTAEQLHQAIDSERYIGALTLGGDAHLHPLNLCLAEAQAASDLGVKLFANSPVTRLTSSSGIYHARTAKGIVQSSFVVLCGNAYASNLHPKISNKILPAGSYIIATEPLSKTQAKQLLPLDTAVCDLNYALDYFRLSADNRLLFGGLCNYSGKDPKSIVSALRPKMLRVFPQLASLKIDYQWGGMIGVGLNRMPQIGRIKHSLYYAQAYAGHGVNATHMAAKVISESIARQSSRIDVFEKIKHYSFPGGRYLQSPLFALGMLYFRLKDYL